MDKIFIKGLKAQAIIGVHGWERQLPRPLLFDLELGVDIQTAASSDQVRDAIDYSAVSETVVRLAGERQPALLETLVEILARELFRQFPILSLHLVVHKPGAVAGTQSVGVEIERRREDYAACGR